MLTTQDRIELHELLARYTHFLDHGQIDRMTEIWTEDCRFVVEQPAVDISGRAALIEFLQQTTQSQPHVRHIITNIFIEDDGDNYSAILNAYLQVTDSAQNSIVMMGRYRDLCIKTTQGWRIKHRNVLAG